ncbi:MAG: hypothetical protein DRJ67_10925 [Thermoprotei archaeon]|nr:MAG: hypothetical protein DRJ67_10925 [Thermoprotei archaeon]
MRGVSGEARVKVVEEQPEMGSPYCVRVEFVKNGVWMAQSWTFCETIKATREGIKKVVIAIFCVEDEMLADRDVKEYEGYADLFEEIVSRVDTVLALNPGTRAVIKIYMDERLLKILRKALEVFIGN